MIKPKIRIRKRFLIPLRFIRNDDVRFEGKGGNNGGSMGAAVVSVALPTDCRHSERSGAE